MIIIALILKLFPYIPTYLRNDYLTKIKNNIKNLDKNYTKLISYFEKNWVNNKFFKFSEISDDDIVKRTNNVCESFHRQLNDMVSHCHPKLGYLLIKLKEYISSSFKNYNDSLYKKVELEIEKINISDEIFDFLVKYKHKVKETINIENFINNLEVFRNDITVLFSKFLNVIYDEDDNFFKEFLNLKKININEDMKLVENENMTGEEENAFIYKEEELNKKLDSLHLSNNHYKDKTFYNDFEDED